MAWQDTLQSLQTELAEVRAERLRQAKIEEGERQSERQRLVDLATSLEINQLIEDMNQVLLRREGSVEVYSSWDPPEDKPGDDLEILRLADDEDDEDDADYISAVLTWDEDGEKEIAVDLGLSEEGLYLQINGIDIRPEREALEQALLEAFREELQV